MNITDIYEVMSWCTTSLYGCTRLGVCYSSLCTSYGSSPRGNFRTFRGQRCGKQPFPTHHRLTLIRAKIQPTAESHLPPAQTLEAARERLLEIFKREFDKASKSRDAAATSRFFKLFPAIGWEEEGLQAYASFVVDLVKVRAPASAKSMCAIHTSLC